VALNVTLDQMDLTGIFRILLSKTVGYIFFSLEKKCTWKILQNRLHIRPQIKSQQIQKNQSHTMHRFRLQCYETRNQLQKQQKIWKEHKYIEVK